MTKLQSALGRTLRGVVGACLAIAAPLSAWADSSPANPPAPRLVEGAPLGNDNVYVHIVERKAHASSGRHELAVYPAVAQINGTFTRHVGAAATYSYHLFESLALQLTPVFNYWNSESAFNQELIDKGHQQAQAATALLLQYGAVAGLEMTPVYGKFALFESTLGHFAVVLNAGVGLGNTRVQLRGAQTQGCDPAAGCAAASFGDTGVKFLGSVGAGFRVLLGGRMSVRLEVRDLVYTARVDRINGCSFSDLELVQSGAAPLDASCRSKTAAQGGPWIREDDRALAAAMLRATSSDVINNLSLYAGVSLLF